MLKTIAWVIIIAAVIYYAVETVIKKSIQKKILTFLANGEFAKYEELKNKTLTRFLLRTSTLKYYDLNAAICKKDSKSVEELLDEFHTSKVAPNKKSSVYVNSFYYFLDIKNNKNCEKCLTYLEELNLPDLYNSVIRMYDTYAKNGYAYLDETLKEYAECKEEEKAGYESILSKMYENKGDKEKANYFLEEAKKKLQNNIN